MEISKENKLTKWKKIIKKLHNTKIADTERLDIIENQIDTNNSLYNDDLEYLKNKHKQLQEFQTPSETSEDSKKLNFERELQLIEQLHQKEIGDFSRLESIRNYLVAGQPLLYEDEVYLKEHHEQLKKVLGLDEFNYNKKSKTRQAPLEPQTILIDDVEQMPTHEFDSLSNTISNIIRNSIPHFTIGLYGEWGTGKTTLMKSIERNLVGNDGYQKGQKILPIWFNAWKYEREENLATVSLLKTVGYAMMDHEKYDGLSKTIFKGLTTVSKDLMQQIAMQVVSNKQEDNEKEFNDKMNYVNKLYRESVYYQGQDKIKEQIQLIREEDSDYRVVIFIDDLDRCSPIKALEVLESIKLFLDMEGFVFVIGLSHKTVTQLITNAYKTTGVKGDDYIKKIIQIPIKIPSWSKESIVDLINNSVCPKLNSDYTRFLRQNSGMVARVVDYNPRQLKRFINNVIIAFETFASNKGSPDIHFNEIFLVKILKSEWPKFYQAFVDNKDFRVAINWMLTKPKDLRKYFRYLKTPTDEFPIEQKNRRFQLLRKLSERTNGRIDDGLIGILSEFDFDTWIFFDNIKEVLFGIEDWKVINNVMDVVEEFSYDLPIGSNKSNDKQVEPIKEETP